MFKPSKIFLFSAAISTRLCERQPLAASVAWRVAISGIASSPAAPRKDGVGVIASRTKQSPPVIASEARSNLNVLEVEPPKEVQPPKIENQKPSTWAVYFFTNSHNGKKRGVDSFCILDKIKQ